MQVPLELTYHDVSRSQWSEDLIREYAARLERFTDEMISCHVTVSQPHKNKVTGNPYRVRVQVRLPRNRDLVVNEEPQVIEQESDLKQTIIAAFKIMERRLKESGEPRRRDALRPGAEEPRALVVRLFADQDYGFLRTPDDREVYFHRNSVLHGDFERLAVGTEVRFEEGMGEMGPQASTVQVVNKPGARESEQTAEREDVPADWQNTQ
jgi:cold shock CspA family protein/ribosome-associated translation inhibitor RaiA